MEGFHSSHLPEDESIKHQEGLFEVTLERMSEATQHLDHQTNIVIGISTAIFVFTASLLEKEEASLALFIMMIFAASSSLAGLLAVHPPKYMRKRGQPESLLYRKVVQRFASAKHYEEAVTEAMASPSKIKEQYAIEIYNVSKYYYRPKRKLFHLSRKLLFYGIFLSLITFLLQILIG
jgi:hypothetical protein